MRPPGGDGMSSEVDLLLGLEGGRNETKRQVPPEAWQSLAQAEVKNGA